MCLLAGLVAAVALLSGSAGSTPARAASAAELQQRISTDRARISTLQSQAAGARGSLGRLDRSISEVSAQLRALDSRLAVERAELLALRARLSAARTRLAALEAAQARDEQVLAAQLVGAYEQGRPDVITVVMEATGFNQLLDQLSFVQHIQRQDARIVATVKAARRAVAAQAIRLGALSERQQQLTRRLALQDQRIAAVRVALVRQRLAVARIVAARQGALAAARAQVASLRSQLERLQAAQAAAQQGAGSTAAPAASAPGASPAAPAAGSGAASNASSGSAGTPAGGPTPTAPSSGGFEFPMPKADVSPPSTWSEDQGVDISAPGGTPELAVCSGTIVLHGIGGFGPSAPVLHCDTPIDGYSYVYYGHAGPGNWVPIGTHVSQGQVISEVGYGIVGISTGPHLEIGFADSSGSPIGSGTASTMMSLLLAAYNG
ncbi:MAG TPA: peptidoglycan DD-metalloendopeptidase family protein [Solirubrobacteraceae bacterium]|nr:peptidoglycan DD-metalloendopeptidase family protein [Solirubrobacteraceae bacterium]